MISTALENSRISTPVYIWLRDSTSLVQRVTMRPTGFVSKKRAWRERTWAKISSRIVKMMSCPIFCSSHISVSWQAVVSSSSRP